MSASSRPTRAPAWASAMATLTLTVVLPTPPLPALTATVFLTPGISCRPGRPLDPAVTAQVPDHLQADDVPVELRLHHRGEGLLDGGDRHGLGHLDSSVYAARHRTACPPPRPTAPPAPALARPARALRTIPPRCSPPRRGATSSSRSALLTSTPVPPISPPMRSTPMGRRASGDCRTRWFSPPPPRRSAGSSKSARSTGCRWFRGAREPGTRRARWRFGAA